MLEVKNITVKAGNKTLLDNASLKTEAGEVVAIVGANGAGKSTLLKAVCGDIKRTQGDVFINNKYLEDWDRCKLARVRAVLPQSSVLSFPFTVFEVALLGRNPHIRGRETKRDCDIAHEALCATEADHLTERFYPTLSGGEQQRTQLARVLAQIWEKPESSERLLLLDEPTSSLDLAHQHATLSLARKFANEGVGVLTVLHDLNLASQYADRVVMLKRGHLICEGSPRKVFNSETIREVFSIDSVVMEHPTLPCPLVIPAVVRNVNNNGNLQLAVGVVS